MLKCYTEDVKVIQVHFHGKLLGLFALEAAWHGMEKYWRVTDNEYLVFSAPNTLDLFTLIDAHTKYPSAMIQIDAAWKQAQRNKKRRHIIGGSPTLLKVVREIVAGTYRD